MSYNIYDLNESYNLLFFLISCIITYEVSFTAYQKIQISSHKYFVPNDICQVCWVYNMNWAFDDQKTTLFNGNIRIMSDVSILILTFFLRFQNKNPFINDDDSISFSYGWSRKLSINLNNCYFLSVLRRQQNKRL